MENTISKRKFKGSQWKVGPKEDSKDIQTNNWLYDVRNKKISFTNNK